MKNKRVTALILLCAVLLTLSGCGECKHKNTSWEVDNIDNITATKHLNLVCTDCGETLETNEEEIETFIDGKVFTLTPEEFVNRLQTEWDKMHKKDLHLDFVYAVDYAGYLNFDIFYDNDMWLGWGWFYDENLNRIDATSSDVPMASMSIYFAIDGIDTDVLFSLLEDLLGPVSCAIDPTIKNGNMYKDPLSENVYAYNEKSLHGLYYTCQYDEEAEQVFLDIDIAS